MLITLLIVCVVLVVFDVAAMRWGVDSADAIDSYEWERRWNRSAASHSKDGPTSHEKGLFRENVALCD